MKQFMLLVENENGEQILEGFFNTELEARDYLKEIDISFSDAHLYQLEENAYDLLQED